MPTTDHPAKMALRIPPGRAGRIWLVGRLEIARRGAELLDRKRQALLREQSHVRAEAASARREWHAAAAEAALWSDRAAMLDGAGGVELLARHVHEQASLELSWSNLMGARIPAIAAATVPDPPPISALGGSSAAIIVASSCCEAVRAAARYAVAQRAERELTAELTRAARRLRALQDRWIPQHEEALARLDLALDESQREQAARVRWLTRRRVPSSGIHG
jgi:V/A-type H+/Na+-transporting ATPase subunit D